jgi:hypothetical protein
MCCYFFFPESGSSRFPLGCAGSSSLGVSPLKRPLLNQNNYLFTGSITGQRYIKTFFDSFNLITGYYLSGLLTGLQDFKINNYITGNSYINSGFISEDIDQLYIQAKTRNYFSNDVISGLLSISGYETGKYANRVISTIITGIR